jgi:predicted DNA-binding transcriptional regulator AlpA
MRRYCAARKYDHPKVRERAADCGPLFVCLFAVRYWKIIFKRILTVAVIAIAVLGAAQTGISEMTTMLDTQPDFRVLTKAEVAAVTGLSFDTIDRMIRRGEGPPRIKLSPRRVGFPIAGLRAWLKSRTVSARDAA